jgi:hypothetical protein
MAFVSFLCVMGAVAPVAMGMALAEMRVDPGPMLRWCWPVTLVGAVAGTVTGIRTLVLFERKENHELQGIWMGFLGMIGGGILVVVGCALGMAAVFS